MIFPVVLQICAMAPGNVILEMLEAMTLVGNGISTWLADLR